MPSATSPDASSAEATTHHGAHAFRQVPRTGVIFVTSEAEKRGYRTADAAWCNLGQGQPETGPLPGAPPRLLALSIPEDAYEYAPVAGLRDLRAAIAAAYNQRFRRGLRSQYSAENVAICGGGRLALARAAVALGEINLGHFLPDYTAYEELLSVFRLFNPIPILLEAERGYQFSTDELVREIQGRGLAALLLSNPSNPTGRTLLGDELAAWVGIARHQDCALLIDEFYSHYIWAQNAPSIVSAAAFVEDVERDPVVLFDGLTKNWRYPGLRVSWTIGPRAVIDAVASAGSFLDGGGSRPAQLAAIGLVDELGTDQETAAIHTAFKEKRTFLVDALTALGVRIDRAPDGGFYVWGDVSGLPEGISDGMGFFLRMLDEKVITVPGAFFDINPGHRRHGRTSRYARHVRFSFGPALGVLERAVARMRTVVGAAAR